MAKEKEGFREGLKGKEPAEVHPGAKGMDKKPEGKRGGRKGGRKSSR